MKKAKLILGAWLLTGSLLGYMPTGNCMSLSLDEAVDMAMKNNPDVLITQLGEERPRQVCGRLEVRTALAGQLVLPSADPIIIILAGITVTITRFLLPCQFILEA